MKCLWLNMKCEWSIIWPYTCIKSRTTQLFSRRRTQTQFPHTLQSGRLAKLTCLNVTGPDREKQICIIYRESQMLCNHIVIKHHWDFIDWLHWLLFNSRHRLHEMVRRTKGCRICTWTHTHTYTNLPLCCTATAWLKGMETCWQRYHCRYHSHPPFLQKQTEPDRYQTLTDSYSPAGI